MCVIDRPETTRRPEARSEIRTDRRVVITVPPATETGTRVRIRGQGETARPGGPAGDLLVTFQVQPDRFFHREGLDIVCEVPLNLAQAALGTRLRVRTLDGKKVVLRIPGGTQPGRKFRIKGQGVEKNGPRSQATNRHVANSAVNRPRSTASEATTGTVIRRLATHHPAHMKSGKITMA